MGNNSGELEFNFKKENTLEERKKRYNELKDLHPDKIPIIIEKDKSCNLKDIGILKFLLNREDTISKLDYHVRKKLDIDNEQFLYLFNAKNSPIPFGISIGEAYDKYKGSDGFLYLAYGDVLICG